MLLFHFFSSHSYRLSHHVSLSFLFLFSISSTICFCPSLSLHSTFSTLLVNLFPFLLNPSSVSIISIGFLPFNFSPPQRLKFTALFLFFPSLSLSLSIPSYSLLFLFIFLLIITIFVSFSFLSLHSVYYLLHYFPGFPSLSFLLSKPLSSLLYRLVSNTIAPFPFASVPS